MKKRIVVALLIVIAFILAVLWLFLYRHGKTDTEEPVKQEQEVKQENASQKKSNTIKEKESKEQKQDEIEPADDAYVRVLDYIPDIEVELKYATADNFTGEVIYSFDEAFLRYGTVKKLMDAQAQLKEKGYRIKIWDAYRPFFAQEKLWEVCPNPRYVANPANGMKAHNLGGTIDMTIVTLDGKEVEMPTGVDDFSLKADRDYSDVSELAAEHASLLEEIMTACGFVGCSSEWWDYSDTTVYEAVDFIP